jgi:competence ComEA-like helix-hairpin-helix protein
MKNSVQNTKNYPLGAPRLASLGTNHGYRFDGDLVHLNAMFQVHDAAAHQRAWALQLWACPVAPRSVTDLTGQLVAEVALPPIGEIADESEGFEVAGLALLPVGSAEHVMVLALVAGQSGQSVDVQDFAVYPQTETFIQPRMAGIAGYRTQGDRVVFEVERIENPRGAANRSGTLALELWALKSEFRGGHFQGTPLAGVAFDALSGQCEYRQCAFDLPFVAPPGGSWNLVLMLREWTAAGFVTRDFVSFARPYTVSAPVVAPAAPSVSKPTPAPAAKSAPEPAVKATAKPEPEPASKPAVAKAKDSQVSVNSASKSELAAIEGMSTKVAEGIVSKRPFKSLDELTKVKGMGEKMLTKLRSKLRL